MTTICVAVRVVVFGVIGLEKESGLGVSIHGVAAVSKRCFPFLFTVYRPGYFDPGAGQWPGCAHYGFIPGASKMKVFF